MLLANHAQVSWLDIGDGENPATDPLASMTRTVLKDFFSPSHGYTPLRSLCTYRWLAAQNFNLVIFVGHFGIGYYSLVARDLGLAFGKTSFAVVGWTSHAHDLEQKERFPEGRTDIELDFLERQTLRRADSLLSHSPDFPDWCRRAGWNLPSAVIPITEDLTLNSLIAAEPKTAPRPVPFISICLPTYNRPLALRAALTSLLRQTSQNFEVIVVNDGSTDPQVMTVLTDLSEIFVNRGWTAIHQKNQGVGAARNAAAQIARGDYLLFMDDDNLALSHEVERFAIAAQSSDADIITCIPGRHPETSLGPDAVATLPTPDPDYPLSGVDWTPVGACLALSAMVNCLGDNNALFRRNAFLALGGYQGTPLSSFEDFRLMLLAVVRGYRLEVLPEILFLYRRHMESRSMRDHLFLSHVDSLSPLTELVPPALWPLLLTAHHPWHQRHLAWAELPPQSETK